MTDEQFLDDQRLNDQLLDRLRAALVPVAASTVPPSTSLQDLHRAIDAATRPGASTPRRRRGTRALTIAVAVSVAAACVAIAMVAATSLPGIDREMTTRITVTATSPALGEVVDRQRTLESALAEDDALAVATAAARLRVALTGLTSSEWIPIRAEIEGLLTRTETYLERRGGDGESPGGSPNPSSTTQPGESSSLPRPTTSAPVQATAPVAPPPTVPAATRTTAATSPFVTTPDDAGDDEISDDDNSGPGGGGETDGDDNSGPGGGAGDDDSGPGSD